ncbi:hypothetical protein VCR4J2_570117 [Vibrio coralliirubri]|nr:hypothetical protein VCR4J2_570117 [Vibrio coralliirubri]
MFNVLPREYLHKLSVVEDISESVCTPILVIVWTLGLACIRHYIMWWR